MAEAWPLWPEGAPLRQSAYETAANKDAPSLTPYLLEGDEIRSAVIICPGGGYGHRSEKEGEPVALAFNALGLHAFVLNYRIAPYRYPAALLDARRAVRFARFHAEQWRINPNRLGVVGFSAGGHLAGSLMLRGIKEELNDAVDSVSPRPDFLALCYPVVSFVSSAHQGSWQNLLGEQATEEQKKALSLELNVSDYCPPVFLWHTTTDSAVPVENSLLLGQALSAQRRPFSLKVFSHGSHGLGLAENDQEIGAWPHLCKEWLKTLNLF